MAFLSLGTATLDRPGELEPIAGYAILFFVDATPGSVKANLRVSSVISNVLLPTIKNSVTAPSIQASQIAPSVSANFVTPTVKSEVEVLP